MSDRLDLLDEKAVYKKTYKVLPGHLDMFGKVKLTEILKDLDDIVGEHAGLLNAGHENNLVKDLFWVISRYKVFVHTLPRLNDELLIRTAICKVEGYQSIRGIQILKGDEILVTVSSSWLLLDLAKRRPQRISEIYQERPTVNILSDEHLYFERIKIPPSSAECYSLQARYSDLDSNDHVNNTRYLEWAFDCLPAELLVSADLRRITTEFLAETKLNEQIKIYCTENSSNQYVVHGINNDSQLKFVILLDYSQ